MLWKPTNRFDSVTVNQTCWIVLFEWWVYMPLAAGDDIHRIAIKYTPWQLSSHCSVTLKGKKKKKKASGKNAIQTIRVYFSSLLFPCYSFLLIRESAMYKDGWKKRILNSVYKIFLLLLFCAISDFLQPMHTSIVTLAYYLQVFSHPYSALKLYCVWLWPFQPLLKQWLR